MKPVRIQRRRAKGFKLPPNTVCVDRSTKWGNPFVVGRDGTRNACVRWHYLLLGGLFNLSVKSPSLDEQLAYLKYVNKNIGLLRGKNLACWCALPKSGEDDECHAAELLKIANVPQPKRKGE